MPQFIQSIKPAHLVKASIFTNLGLAAVKALLGVFSLSIFLCINALYNLGIALAKYFILDGITRESEGGVERKDSVRVGVILLFSSVIYILYSTYTLTSPPAQQYHMFIAIGIAAFTFAEVVLNLKGVFSKKKEKTHFMQLTKLTNLASSFIGLALTQRAILSFTSPGENLARANGSVGIIFGSLAVLLGIYIIYNAKQETS